MFDPLSNADIYESEWDLYLHEHVKTIDEVEELYKEGLITEDEYKQGIEVVKKRKWGEND